MAKLTNVKINGDVQSSNPDGSWHHNIGVHANSKPANQPNPLPTDNLMSWNEGTPQGNDVNEAKMTSMEEAADLITLKGNCTQRHSVKVAADAPKIEMTLLVRKTGGTNNKGEAAVVFSDDTTREPKFLPFFPYVTIVTS
jgi:hypothetical protein